MKKLSDRLHYAMQRTTPPIRAVDLAKQLGVSKSIVSNWLSDKTVTMSSANLSRTATILGVSAGWLGDGNGPMKLTLVNHNPNPVNQDFSNAETMRRATRFLIDQVGLDVMQFKGADWTADTLLKLYDLFNDPASAKLNEETILKIIN